MIIQDTKYTNQLINENSPYLLQHAHNPVDWYPWGREAFDKARQENKLVLVSIGYAACHWCHVMERESFEDAEVAAIMNRNFVCIKVDREERPDIDQVYMDAVQLLTQRGGWPLNCFALPDGRPVWGGTYFPKNSWKEVLQSLHDVYRNDYEKVIEQAEAITTGLSDISPLIRPLSGQEFNRDLMQTVFKSLSTAFDLNLGGSKGAPKFPMPVVYDFLLRYYFQVGDRDALGFVTLTLDKMALGGIYDHLGGGFARYSTDDRWFAPHFEKMLYDNAQLVSLYSKAFKISQNKNYQHVVVETLKFIQRELTSPNGGFYSSLDADSEGEEGKYYVWKRKEIDAVLGNQAELFCQNYSVREKGNWEEGKNILYLEKFPDEALRHQLNSCRELLLEARSKRVPPRLDSKILCSWNALMLEAFLDAYTTFRVDEYLATAIANAGYLDQNHVEKGKVWRVNQNAKKINGFLDDYAFLAKAFIRLFQVSCNEKWLHKARAIADHAILNFYDNQSGMFFYTSAEDQPLAVRKHELHDNVTPASNSVMAAVLLNLNRYFVHETYGQTALKMLRNIAGSTLQFPWYHAGWARVMCDLAFPVFEIAITGPAAHEKVMELESRFLPNILVCASENESFLPLLENRFKLGETWLYVCENQSCKLPVNKVEAVLEQLTGA